MLLLVQEAQSVMVVVMILMHARLVVVTLLDMMRVMIPQLLF